MRLNVVIGDTRITIHNHYFTLFYVGLKYTNYAFYFFY